MFGNRKVVMTKYFLQTVNAESINGGKSSI